MPDPREVIAAPLPTWKDLTYEQLDLYYGECVYREITLMATGGFTDATLSLFVSNCQKMAIELGKARDAITAAV